MEETNTNERTENGSEENIKELMTIKLGEPYKYDGEEIKEIDLSGLMDLTARDMVELDREMIRLGFTGARFEMTRQYALLTAAKINHKPADYCDRMSARDSIRIKEYVTAFFYATA